jgi:hypothetical protein
MILVYILAAAFAANFVSAYCARRFAPSRGRPRNQWMWLSLLWGPFMLLWLLHMWPQRPVEDD